MVDQSDAGWPIRQKARRDETTTSNVAARGIDGGSDNNSAYCLHTRADTLADVGRVASGGDMADVCAFWGADDGVQGRIDAATVCTAARHTAKWEKVDRKGESCWIAKDAGDLLHLSQANATASNSARMRTGHPLTNVTGTKPLSPRDSAVTANGSIMPAAARGQTDRAADPFIAAVISPRKKFG